MVPMPNVLATSDQSERLNGSDRENWSWEPVKYETSPVCVSVGQSRPISRHFAR